MTTPFKSERLVAVFGLLVFLALEFWLFDQVGAPAVNRVYPRWNDQIQYLTEAYTCWETVLHAGWRAGLWQSLVNPAAQGIWHDTAALGVFGLSAPSRSAALAVNVLALIAWQVALWTTLRSSLRTRSWAWVGLALPLALRSPWDAQPGSAFDFRLDWLAACTLGLAAVWAVRTAGFRRWGPSMIFGGVVGLALTGRFLTGTYLALIWLVFAAWVLAGPERWSRLLRLTVAAVVAAGLAAPFFWLNRDWVWNYYVIGHFTGPESAIRNPHFGLLASTRWVFERLYERQLGPTFVFAALSLVVITGLIRFTRSRWTVPLATTSQTGGETMPPEADDSTRSADWWVPALAFLLAPLLVQIFHVQKSEIVLVHAVPGLILVLLAALRTFGPISSDWLRRVIIGAVVAISGFHYARAMTRSDVVEESVRKEARVVNTVVHEILTRSDLAGREQPRVAIDHVSDALDAQVLRVIVYERYGRWIPFVMTLPTGIAEAPDELIQERLEQSDFIIVSLDGETGNWPFDQQNTARRATTLQWCRDHLELVGEYDLRTRHVALFARPNPAR